MDNACVEQIHDKFNTITKKPEKFLSAPEKLVDNIKELLKETYDFVKSNETTKAINTLPNLIVKKFDVEQIWQQIELQNDDILTKHLRSVGRLVAQKDNLWLVEEDDNSNGNNETPNGDNLSENDLNEDENDINDNENDSNEEEIHTDEDNEKQEKKNKVIKSSKKSSVDDEFFKLDEMEKFLNREEQNTKSKKKDSDDDDDDEESVDLFDMKSGDELEDDDDKEDESETENNPKYDEFFGDGNDTEDKKRKRATEESSDDDENNEESDKEDTNFKSSLEMKNERLHKKIEDIEEQALQDKSWQYKGEVTADKRPQNSLLEEIVDFDMTVRPAPVITEETTYKLEDVIRKRIKDKVWDDVERKTKLVDTFVEYKKKLMLDQEKSKQSLAQIYEDEYLKQKEALNPDAEDKPEKEPVEQTEIKTMMKNLFSKLDALSNFHFTPKSVAPELRIVNNLPAINMEEVVPVASSDATLLAPEEIKKKTKGDIIGKTERTKTDKNRERRQKKLKQREHAKNKEKKNQNQKVGLGAKYNKQKAASLLEKVTKDSNVNKMNESGGVTKSSTKFFTQLQEEVRGHIKNKTQMKKQNNKPTHIAKKLKL